MAAVIIAEREPAHYGNLQHTALSAFWFGMNFLWIPLTTVLIQAQVDEVVPKGSQNTAIGVALGVGGVLAMAVPPLVGAWSDRLNTRFGRRRPIMVAGTLLTLPGLLILMAANNYLEIVIGYAIIQFFFNAAGAAYAGIIPDVVPAQQVGKASGFLATMTQLGIGGGLGVTSVMSHNRLVYLVMGVVAALCLIPTLWAARTEGMEPIAPPPHRPFAETIKEFLRPLHEGDFAWVVFTRLMVSSGITVVLYFLVNFFGDVVLPPGTDAAKFTDNWLLVVVVTALPFGFFGGQISDRIRRRKIFVYLAGAAQSFVALVFIVSYPKSIPLVYALGVAYGVGYGLYFAVDWALACDTLPDKTKSAKDMGLFHIALTLPQAILPLFGGALIDYLNKHLAANSGYRVVFSSAVVFLFVGTFLVSRIKAVR
ncbi:MAG TPA: MFS transporter [Candidatus Acidoferrum sp.]|jgi:MFS family permease|nr:MFS transporter [Candidatus Acidoferrum sp.]